MKHVISLIMFFFSSCFITFGQCNIEVTKLNEDYTSHRFVIEQISDAIMLEKGGLIVYLETDGIVYRNGESNLFMIKLYVGNIQTTTTFAPREFIVNFINDEQMTLEATDYKYEDFSGSQKVIGSIPIFSTLIIRELQQKVVTLFYLIPYRFPYIQSNKTPIFITLQ